MYLEVIFAVVRTCSNHSLLYNARPWWNAVLLEQLTIIELVNTLRKGLLNCLNARSRGLTFRHRASCI